VCFSSWQSNDNRRLSGPHLIVLCHLLTKLQCHQQCVHRVGQHSHKRLHSVWEKPATTNRQMHLSKKNGNISTTNGYWYIHSLLHLTSEGHSDLHDERSCADDHSESIVHPWSSSTCCIQVFLGRPGGRFQSGAGHLPCERLTQCCMTKSLLITFSSTNRKKLSYYTDTAWQVKTEQFVMMTFVTFYLVCFLFLYMCVYNSMYVWVCMS